MAEWIKETTSSSNYNLTAGDYEEPEDIIEQLEETGTKLFSVRVEGLDILQDGWYYFAPKDKLSKEQLKIFEELRKKEL